MLCRMFQGADPGQLGFQLGDGNLPVIAVHLVGDAGDAQMGHAFLLSVGDQLFGDFLAGCGSQQVDSGLVRFPDTGGQQVIILSGGASGNVPGGIQGGVALAVLLQGSGIVQGIEGNAGLFQRLYHLLVITLAAQSGSIADGSGHLASGAAVEGILHHHQHGTAGVCLNLHGNALHILEGGQRLHSLVGNTQEGLAHLHTADKVQTEAALTGIFCGGHAVLHQILAIALCHFHIAVSLVQQEIGDLIGKVLALAGEHDGNLFIVRTGQQGVALALDEGNHRVNMVCSGDLAGNVGTDGRHAGTVGDHTQHGAGFPADAEDGHHGIAGHQGIVLNVLGQISAVDALVIALIGLLLVVEVDDGAGTVGNHHIALFLPAGGTEEGQQGDIGNAQNAMLNDLLTQNLCNEGIVGNAEETGDLKFLLFKLEVNVHAVVSVFIAVGSFLGGTHEAVDRVAGALVIHIGHIHQGTDQGLVLAEGHGVILGIFGIAEELGAPDLVHHPDLGGTGIKIQPESIVFSGQFPLGICFRVGIGYPFLCFHLCFGCLPVQEADAPNRESYQRQQKNCLNDRFQRNIFHSAAS